MSTTMLARFKVKDLARSLVVLLVPLLVICTIVLSNWDLLWKRTHTLLCQPPQTPALLEIINGRNETQYPSQRCCEDSGCLKNDNGRYAVLTTLRSDNYFSLLVNLECSLRRSNPQIKLLVAMVKGDVAPAVEAAIRNLGEHISIVYWEDFYIENKLKSRFSLNWVKVRAWEMDDWDALLMVDSDTVILEDISHLFKIPAHFATVLDEDKTTRQYNSLGSMQGGVVLLRPCKRTAIHMISILNSNEHVRFPKHHAEQTFFDWYFRYERWALPVKYNSISERLLPSDLTRGGTRPAIVHFTRKGVNIKNQAASRNGSLRRKEDSPFCRDTNSNDSAMQYHLLIPS